MVYYYYYYKKRAYCRCSHGPTAHSTGNWTHPARIMLGKTYDHRVCRDQPLSRVRGLWNNDPDPATSN